MSFKDEESFQVPLMDEVDSGREWAHLLSQASRSRVPRENGGIRLAFQLYTPWLLLAILLSSNLFWYHRRGPSNPAFSELLYSPAQDALEYEIRKFDLGLGENLTPYQGQPSPEIDKKWYDLYSMAISRISRDDARPLVNRTVAIPGDEEHYIIELDVFHQLHCLNMIRKALSPDYYKGYLPGVDGEDELMGFHHINHCVDAIRQSLMCTVDVTPLVWGWSEKDRALLERGTVLHTCRSFEKVQDWARARNKHGRISPGTRVMNDPLDPTTWSG